MCYTMARIQYKEKCKVCKKNYVLTTSRSEFLVCYECQKAELERPIEDEVMRNFFDIPQEFYFNNNFLRNIKANYFRYGSLTDKQKEAFKKVVGQMEDERAGVLPEKKGSRKKISDSQQSSSEEE